MLLRPIITFVFCALPVAAFAAPLYLGAQEVPDERQAEALEHCRALEANEDIAIGTGSAFRAVSPEVEEADDEAASGESGAGPEFAGDDGPADQDDDFSLDEVTLEDCKQAGLVH